VGSEQGVGKRIKMADVRILTFIIPFSSVDSPAPNASSAIAFCAGLSVVCRHGRHGLSCRGVVGSRFITRVR